MRKLWRLVFLILLFSAAAFIVQAAVQFSAITAGITTICRYHGATYAGLKLEPLNGQGLPMPAFQKVFWRADGIFRNQLPINSNYRITAYQVSERTWNEAMSEADIPGNPSKEELAAALARKAKARIALMTAPTASCDIIKLTKARTITLELKKP